MNSGSGGWGGVSPPPPPKPPEDAGLLSTTLGGAGRAKRCPARETYPGKPPGGGTTAPLAKELAPPREERGGGGGFWAMPPVPKESLVDSCVRLVARRTPLTGPAARRVGRAQAVPSAGAPAMRCSLRRVRRCRVLGAAVLVLGLCPRLSPAPGAAHPTGDGPPGWLDAAASLYLPWQTSAEGEGEGATAWPRDRGCNGGRGCEGRTRPQHPHIGGRAVPTCHSALGCLRFPVFRLLFLNLR